MQIKNIILYKDADHVRVLPFELGKVNIITGESKSGKTAIIDIVDYCLGSNDCKIAEGVIKDQVYWFALTIVFESKEEFFIARLNPNVRGTQTVSEIYLEEGPFAEAPPFDNIHNNSNTAGLKELLSRKLNIAENLQMVEGNTRDALEVNFKHSRIFCFQPQGLIAQRDYLFYNQTEPFVPQAIKDSLPYFLGAVREDNLKIEQQITQKRRELNKLNRDKNDAERIRAEGISKSFSLVEEAKQIGILNKSVTVTTVPESLRALDSIKDWEYVAGVEATGEGSVVKQLIDQRAALREELGILEDTIGATQSFVNNNFSYSDEVEHHKIRLETIHLFDESDQDHQKCPLCENPLAVEVPKVSTILKSLNSLSRSLESTVREKPRLTKYLQELAEKQENLKSDILKAEQSLAALYTERENARTLRDLNIRRGKVIGRVSLFLESVDFTEDKSVDLKIEALKSEIEVLMSGIDKESKDEKLVSILSKINLQMSKWVDQLDVEYKNSPIRFDINKLTIFADTLNKPIGLSQMGSGANWVSYHLLIHFALHQHFIQTQRPVPHFLMLDQPSQVYFPPEKDADNTGEIRESADEIAVRQMFEFIIDMTVGLEKTFQVIITDHAFLNSDKFKSHVQEIWRDGVKLIPEEWYAEQQ
jgi:hypothetical protein